MDNNPQRILVKSFLEQNIPVSLWPKFMCNLQLISKNYTILSMVDNETLKSLVINHCERCYGT